MRRFLAIFIVFLFLFSLPAFADERKTIYEGMGMKLVSIVDSMSDEKSCALFVDAGYIYIAIYGHDDFKIFSNNEYHPFAPDGKHLMRCSNKKPASLMKLPKHNALKPINPTYAASFIKELVEGKEVQIRYYSWPEYKESDKKLRFKTLDYVYDKAVRSCGWKDLGTSNKLPKAELSIHIWKEPEYEGSANVSVIGNEHFWLRKGFDKYGGGCHISLHGYDDEIFGMQGGKWTCGTWDMHGNQKLIIRNASGNVLFSEEVPRNTGRAKEGNPWSYAHRAAKIAWEASPEGSIALEQFGSGEKMSLYGFKELWKWGIKNCGFPPLDQ